MDQLKHFSHNHGLGCHQVPQGSELQCWGCKSPPGSGNFWVCWQCNYFLDEQCFRAPRFLKHPSHPLHPLTLVPCPTYPSGSFVCNACNLAGNGFSYCCSACEFDIHLHCALSYSNPIPNPNTNPHLYPVYPTVSQPIPTTTVHHFSHPHSLNPFEIEQEAAKTCSACELQLHGSAYCCTEPNCSFILHKACFNSPREIQQESHSEHPALTLLPTPQGFTCNACCQQGKSLAYTCGACSYILHVDCIRMADPLTRPIHEHPLMICYSAGEANKDSTLMCGVCDEAVHRNAWRYICQDHCGFRCHTMCVYKQKKKKADLTPLEQMKMLQDLDLMMQMNRFNAHLIANIGRW